MPLRRYEQFWDEWWRDTCPGAGATPPGRGGCPISRSSSGTTSGTHQVHPGDAARWCAPTAARRSTPWRGTSTRIPRSRVFGGLSFMLGGSTALERVAPGVRQGDLSGIAAAEVPRFLGPWSWPPPALALDRRLGPQARRRWPRKRRRTHIRVLTGTPSLAAGAAGAARGAAWRLAAAARRWSCWCMAASPGRPTATGSRRFLPPGCATREVYPASEGFVAIADRGDGEGLRLCLDRGCFFEFVPVDELDAPRAAPALGGDDRDRRGLRGGASPPAPGSGPMCWATRCASWTARRRGCW